MKNNARIQIMINVEYEQVHNDSDRLIKYIVSNLENNLHQAAGAGALGPPVGDEFEVTAWNVDISLVDPAKTKAQFQSERDAPFGSIKAYFSSDGPALSIDLGPGESPYQDVWDSIADINGALREAFHKYQANLRGG